MFNPLKSTVEQVDHFEVAILVIVTTENFTPQLKLAVRTFPCDRDAIQGVLKAYKTCLTTSLAFAFFLLHPKVISAAEKRRRAQNCHKKKSSSYIPRESSYIPQGYEFLVPYI